MLNLGDKMTMISFLKADFFHVLGYRNLDLKRKKGISHTKKDFLPWEISSILRASSLSHFKTYTSSSISTPSPSHGNLGLPFESLRLNTLPNPFFGGGATYSCNSKRFLLYICGCRFLWGFNSFGGWIDADEWIRIGIWIEMFLLNKKLNEVLI